MDFSVEDKQYGDEPPIIAQAKELAKNPIEKREPACLPLPQLPFMLAYATKGKMDGYYCSTWQRSLRDGGNIVISANERVVHKDGVPLIFHTEEVDVDAEYWDVCSGPDPPMINFLLKEDEVARKVMDVAPKDEEKYKYAGSVLPERKGYQGQVYLTDLGLVHCLRLDSHWDDNSFSEHFHYVRAQDGAQIATMCTAAWGKWWDQDGAVHIDIETVQLTADATSWKPYVTTTKGRLTGDITQKDRWVSFDTKYEGPRTKAVGDRLEVHVLKELGLLPN